MEPKRVMAAAGSLLIDTATADRLIRRGSGIAALVYLHILRSGGIYDETLARRELQLKDEQLREALSVLREEGIVREDPREGAPSPVPPEKPRPLQDDELPQYSGDDVKNKLAGDAVFASLVREVQSALGKLLSSEDTMKLYGFYDRLGLPPEVILLLVHHCIGLARQRGGPGRVPGMRAIEREALRWEEEGITSLELAEAYLKQQEQIDGLEGAFAKELKIQGRALTETEKGYVRDWLKKGFREDAAAIAYDRTVTRTGGLRWKYMDSIFQSWHGKGLHTAAEILQGDGRQGAGKKAPRAAAQDAVSREDIDQMDAYLKRLTGE